MGAVASLKLETNFTLKLVLYLYCEIRPI